MFLLMATAMLGVSTLTVSIYARADEVKQPNIVFILADDLGWGDVSYNGSTWVETPNIDKLANNGRIFDNAYSYPTCSPARAALLTGKQSFKTQVYGVPVLEKGNNKTSIFSRGTVQLEHAFYSEPLHKAGYKLAHLGKWHVVGPYPQIEVNYPFNKKSKQPKNGDLSWLDAHKTQYSAYYPEKRGFDLNVGGTWWGDPARGYKEGYDSKSGGYIAPFKNPFITDKKDDEWLTDRLTDDAIGFMQEHKDKPFFINLHYYAPHRPSIPRNKALLEKYQNKQNENLTGKNAKELDELAAYGTLIESVDDNIGRITDFLNTSGLRENTIIIFTSDNGFNSKQTVDHRFRGYKGSIYEGGVKVPAFINWQNKVSAKRVANVISVLDYFPSFLELANISEYKGDIDGQSFVPLLFNKPYQEKPIYWHINSAYKHEPVSAMREGPYKLIQFLLSGKVELYEIDNDPSESKELSTINPKLTQRMLAKLTHWRKDNNVPLPPASILNGNKG